MRRLVLLIALASSGPGFAFLVQSGDDRKAPGKPATTDYALSVKTGDKLFASTDAGIYVTIVGKKGSTGEHKVAGSFDRNETDKVTLKGLKDVGELVSVTVRSDGKGKRASWLLDHLTVTPRGKKAVRFDCNAWLEKEALTRTLRR